MRRNLTWSITLLLGCTGGPSSSLDAGLDAGHAPDAGLLDPALDAGSDASANTVDDLSSLVERVRAEHDLIALGGAIVDGNGVRALGVSGRRRIESEEPVQTGDLWHLGSDTKAMTATLAAIEVQAGHLRWEQTLAETFSSFSDEMHASSRQLTLIELLNHRAGFSGQLPSEQPALWAQLWQNEGPLREQRLSFARAYLALEPAHSPRDVFAYSNEGFVIAGAVLEAASGVSWEERMETHLFAPLSMNSCGFGAPGSSTEVDQPRGHSSIPAVHSVSGSQADNPPAIGPAGTVHCSLADWGKFIALHLRGSRSDTELLPRAAFERLHTPVWAEDGYAYGWAITEVDGVRALTHTGSNTMWFAVVWIAPELDRAFLAVTNIANAAATAGTDELIGELFALTR